MQNEVAFTSVTLNTSTHQCQRKMPVGFSSAFLARPHKCNTLEHSGPMCSLNTLHVTANNHVLDGLLIMENVTTRISLSSVSFHVPFSDFLTQSSSSSEPKNRWIWLDFSNANSNHDPFCWGSTQVFIVPGLSCKDSDRLLRSNCLINKLHLMF